MDGRHGQHGDFVDNRVDPADGATVPYVLPEGADRIGTRDRIKGLRSAAGRFGRFAAALDAVSPRRSGGGPPDGT